MRTPAPTLPIWDLGLLGGTGPLASAWMETQLLREAARRGARADADFPALLHLNAAHPGTGALGDDPAQHDALRASLDAHLRLLQASGVQLVVPTCNTLSGLIQELAWARGLDTITPLRAAASAAAALSPDQPWSTWTIVSSRRTRDQDLYGAEFALHALKTLSIDDHDQETVDILIARAMGGNLGAQGELVDLLTRLQWGSDGVVIGCSELSMLLPDDHPAHWICASRALATSALDTLQELRRDTRTEAGRRPSGAHQ